MYYFQRVFLFSPSLTIHAYTQNNRENEQNKRQCITIKKGKTRTQINLESR